MALEIPVGAARYRSIQEAAAARPDLLHVRLDANGRTILAFEPGVGEVIIGVLIEPIQPTKPPVQASIIPGLFGLMPKLDLSSLMLWAGLAGLVALVYVVTRE